MKVDASLHLPLISRVIGQMGFKGDAAEEAFSEGLVALTEAARKYDPGRNVPVANWLAINIRWSLQTWRSKQHLTFELPQHLLAPKRTEESSAELKEVLTRAELILTPIERQVILAHAYGYKGREIAKTMGKSTGWVSKTLKRAQTKLRERK